MNSQIIDMYLYMYIVHIHFSCDRKFREATDFFLWSFIPKSKCMSNYDLAQLLKPYYRYSESLGNNQFVWDTKLLNNCHPKYRCDSCCYSTINNYVCMERVDLARLDDLNDIEHHETNDFEWISWNDTI